MDIAKIGVYLKAFKGNKIRTLRYYCVLLSSGIFWHGNWRSFKIAQKYLIDKKKSSLPLSFRKAYRRNFSSPSFNIVACIATNGETHIIDVCAMVFFKD
jgi:hypothetical protein